MSSATTHVTMLASANHAGRRGARCASRIATPAKAASSRIVRNARPTMPFCGADEHPHDAHDRGGDERADRDPDRGAQERRAGRVGARVRRCRAGVGHGHGDPLSDGAASARPSWHAMRRDALSPSAAAEILDEFGSGEREQRAPGRKSLLPRMPPPITTSEPPRPRRRRGSASRRQPIGVMPPYSMPVSATASSRSARDADRRSEPPHRRRSRRPSSRAPCTRRSGCRHRACP